jgi:hypothetical protein
VPARGPTIGTHGVGTAIAEHCRLLRRVAERPETSALEIGFPGRVNIVVCESGYLALNRGIENLPPFAQGKVRARIVELHAEIASRSATAAALTLDAHMEKLRELRDEARQRGQLSAAIQAEVKRGELRRFYVKQVESGDAGEFDRMTDDELREYIAGQDKILASLEGKPKH